MPPEPIRIRDANVADIPAITRIYAPEVETGVASLEEVAPSEEEMAARMAKIQDLGLPYMIAERGGAVLGYCYAGPFHARSAYRFTLEDTVYIDHAARRQGVAHALLTTLLARCAALGCRQMMALITRVDNSPSIALHEKLGFQPMGVAHSVGYKFGRWTDVAYMQRTIGPGDTTPPDRAAPGQPVGA